MELIDHLSDKAKKDYMLVQRALNDKDQRAYTEIMGRYKDSVYYMLLKMVNNSDDAEDLTIETFSKAFKRLDQYTPQFAFSTWLFKIASNHSIDFIRKKRIKAISIDQGYSNADGESYVIPVKEEGLDPEESMEKDERIQRMRDVVEKLKPRYKRLVELRYLEEKSYEEISDILELPLGTVKAQLFRARDFMFELMKTTKGNF
jgi:RNA polymerase sigma-70 factor (ECF subfamily)